MVKDTKDKNVISSWEENIFLCRTIIFIVSSSFMCFLFLSLTDPKNSPQTRFCGGLRINKIILNRKLHP